MKVRQSTLTATGENFGGGAAGQFDQAASFIERQRAQGGEVIFDQPGFDVTKRLMVAMWTHFALSDGTTFVVVP